MKQKIIFNLFALAAVVLAFPVRSNAQIVDSQTSPQTAKGAYSVIKSFKLNKSFSGIDGKIELLRDARLADDVSVMQAKGFLPDFTGEDAKTKEVFEKAPISPAVLRVVDGGGKIVDAKALECISARIEAVKLYATAKPTYQVTCHYANFAPYDGEEATFVEVSKGRLQRLEAFDSRTGAKIEMAFVYSHRVGWEFSHPASGKSKDIFSVFTGWTKNEADESDGDFLVVYSRFHFDGKRWVRYERKVEEDYWEDEFGFPERAKFPKAR
jgi:hypothetical protein